MTSSTSSANAQALFHYADAAASINSQLEHEAQLLRTALQDVAASCTAFESGTGPELAELLQAYIQRVAPADAQVREVGTAFRAADIGSIGHNDLLTTAGLTPLLPVTGALPPLTDPQFPGGPAIGPDGKLLRYDLPVELFEQMSADQRKQWVAALECTLGKGPWFQNVRDVIDYFSESDTLHNLRRGSWTSWSDAAVLEAIQNGFAISSGYPPASYSGGAATRWARFFNELRGGTTDMNTLLPLWASAEQAGVNYGSEVADGLVGRPTGDEGKLLTNFIAVGNFYRGLARIPGGGEMFAEMVDVQTRRAAAGRAGELIGGPLGGLAGRSLGTLQGEIEAPLAGEVGEWLVDPRTVFPGLEHGPAYYGGKVAEQITFGNLSHIPIIILLKPIPPAPGMGDPRIPIPTIDIPDLEVAPDGTLSMPGGAQIAPDGTIILRDGSVIGFDGTVTKPDGSSVPTRGTRIEHNGDIVLSDGTNTSR